MGLMTNFKFWLIVGNPNPAQWCFLSWAWPANIYRLFRIGFFSPVSCNKNRKGERVCWDWGETRRWAITGAFCSHAKAKVSFFFFFFFFFIDTLCLFILCVVLPYFSGFWNLGSSISSLPFYFIHSYRWIWFVRVRENI